ncbi:hypothetical protein DPEC_G00068770 [Dallia pectoralis]|nr:hypothetical protein DPEC_G00068770 [Dallia pectoralis]
MLLRHATQNTKCSCESSSSSGVSAEMLSEEAGVSPLVNTQPVRPRSKRPRGIAKCGETVGSRTTARILWAYEMDNVVTAYRWLMTNRSRAFPKGCDAVIVYQLEKSRCLPPGLYVYRTCPSHFGCTAERPLMVLDQFNFVCQPEQVRSWEGLPRAITIGMFPGREHFSALYVISRKLAIPVLEYGNRIYGEARALEIIESYSTMNAIPCEHHEVAMRTERECVIDLRWKGFETKTACLKAIPKVRGLQAVVWSNHSGDFQDIECKVLAWLFGVSNTLPKEVQLMDFKREALGVRYILMDMKMFPGVLPMPPIRDVSFFVHTYFTGDFNLATTAIGEVPGTRSRIGSPCPNSSAFSVWYSLPAMGYCQPTPFSCGVRHGHTSTISEGFKRSLLEWTLGKDGTSCLAVAVQHTLCYHGGERKYKMVLSHTVMDHDTTLNMFKL